MALAGISIVPSSLEVLWPPTLTWIGTLFFRQCAAVRTILSLTMAAVIALAVFVVDVEVGIKHSVAAEGEVATFVIGVDGVIDIFVVAVAAVVDVDKSIDVAEVFVVVYIAGVDKVVVDSSNSEIAIVFVVTAVS